MGDDLEETMPETPVSNRILLERIAGKVDSLSIDVQNIKKTVYDVAELAREARTVADRAEKKAELALKDNEEITYNFQTVVQAQQKAHASLEGGQSAIEKKVDQLNEAEVARVAVNKNFTNILYVVGILIPLISLFWTIYITSRSQPQTQTQQPQQPQIVYVLPQTQSSASR